MTETFFCANSFVEEVAKNVVECGKMECHNYVIFEGISTSAKQKYIIFLHLLKEMWLKLIGI